MVDYRPQQPFSLPHRKPVPITNLRSDIRPLTQIHPDASFTHSPQAQTPNSTTTTTTTTYSSFPPRTTSANPVTSSPASQPYNNAMFTSRRTPSQSTTTSATYLPSRTPSNVSSKISRTSSTRSVVTPPSYVALMRKQKATVWCDRAQLEDPRLLAQQKAAKQRATRELTSLSRGVTSGDARSITNSSMGSGGVRSKIRHHGVPKAHGVGFNKNMMGGGGVPMRLSANEVGDEGTYNPTTSQPGGAAGPPVPHKRNSSLQSRDSRFLSVETNQVRRLSQGSTPISQYNDIPELEEEQTRGDSFGNRSGKSGGSGSEKENSFGGLGSLDGPSGVGVGGGFTGTKGGAMGSNNSTHTPSHSTIGARARAGSGTGKSADDLKRRGSVDERGLFPQGTGRLVIANPDADSDSD